MKDELLCFWECLRFSGRHPRYLVILVMLYAGSVTRWRRMRAARFGYAFMQLFDDFMDGDRQGADPPDVIAETTREEWMNGQFSRHTTLSRLGSSFHRSLQTGPMPPGDTPLDDTTALLKCMHEDARRRTERRLSSQAELERQWEQTFFYSVNLLLLCCGHPTRARDVPALVAALAWCSVVRDFAADAGKGLFNVPLEVLGDAPPGADVLSLPQVNVWLERLRASGPALLQACETELVTVAERDPPAARLLGVFVRSMHKYCPPLKSTPPAG